MLTAQHKLGNLSLATQDAVFATFSEAGYTIAELLRPGTFNVPAEYGGYIPRKRNELTKLKQTIWVFVTAKDGKALFASDGFDDEGRLCFQAVQQTMPLAEPNGHGEALTMPPKRPVGRPPTKPRAGV